MKKYVSFLLVLLFCLTLAACGGSVEPDPNLGTYTAESARGFGITMSVEELWENGVSFTLKENGRCTVNLNGKDYSIKWTLTDGIFHAEGGGAEFDGTLSGGVMVLEDILDSGVTLTLVNPDYTEPAERPASETGREIPEEEPETPEAEPVTFPGWWVSAGMEMGSAVVEGDAVKELLGIPAEELMALDIREDGTAVVSLMGESACVLWSETGDGMELRIDEETVLGTSTFEDGVLRLEEESGVLLLQKTAERPAALEACPWFYFRADLSTDETMEMSNFMGEKAYLVDGDRLYGRVFVKGRTLSQFGYMGFEMTGNDVQFTDRVVLSDDTYGRYLNLLGDKLYFLSTAKPSEENEIVRMNTDGSGREVLYPGKCSYFQTDGERLYFTDSEHRFVSTDLNGGDLRVIIDKATYYTYLLNDWVIYQDDGDNESLHLWYMPTGTDWKLNDIPSYSPIISGQYLYFCSDYDGDASFYHLCRMDLSTLTMEEFGYTFPMEISEKNVLSDIVLDGEIIHGDNDAAVTEEDWMQLENDSAHCASNIMYITTDYMAEMNFNEKDYVHSVTFFDRASGYGRDLPFFTP